jgi:hypothetical protein
MKRQLTENEIDRLVRTLVNKTAFDDATVDEIADSPQLWWGVQRKIKADEKPQAIWQTGFLRRWLMLGAPLTVAALLLVAFFALKPGEKTVDQVSITSPESSNETVNTDSESKSVEVPFIKETTVETTKKSTNFVKKAVIEKKNPRPQQLKSTTIAKSEPIEVKSEFIALSYARNPESGQIVRVKVPSSMLVSLGLVASVEKPNNLVNAELLVGDDGMTHAIRFIR